MTGLDLFALLVLLTLFAAIIAVWIILGMLPGGAFGTGAIYTDSVKITHIIRKVMIRMTAWLNYIVP